MDRQEGKQTQFDHQGHANSSQEDWIRRKEIGGWDRMAGQAQKRSGHRSYALLCFTFVIYSISTPVVEIFWMD